MLTCIDGEIWTQTPGCIVGYEDTSLTGITNMTDCKMACEHQHQFVCLSVDYSEVEDKCELSTKKKASILPSEYEDLCGDYQHAERCELIISGHLLIASIPPIFFSMQISLNYLFPLYRHYA